MGSLELLSYFWLLNTIWVVKIGNFDFDGLSHPPSSGDASRGSSIDFEELETKKNLKAMGLVFIGPILASSVLPLLARPTFVFQEVAGKSLLAPLKSITINRQQMSSQSPSPILRDPSQRHPPWCLSPLHPLLYCPWKLSPTVLVLL